MPPIVPDQPCGAALLDAARHALLDDVAPALDGRRRYVALMVANAIGIVMREIEGSNATAQVWRRALTHVPDAARDPLTALAAEIRAGHHDGDIAFHEALRETTNVAAGIWKPAPSEDAVGSKPSS